MAARMPLRPLLPLLVLLSLMGMSCRHTPAPTPTAHGPRPAFSDAPAFPGWIEACGGGEADACRRLLSSIFFSGRTELLAQGASAFRRGCDAGSADGCTGAILSSLSEENPVLDAEGLGRACTEGSAFACLMQLPMQYQAVPDEEALAALLASHVTLCEEQGGVHCSTVSSAFEAGTGVEPDPSRALALAEKGCEGKDPASCYQLGLLRHALATQAPPEAAPASSTQDEDVASGAEAPGAAATTEGGPAASAHSDGAADRAAHAAASLQAFLGACDAYVGPACLNAAQLLFNGVGGDADPQAARLRAWEACELGERDACDLLALSDEGRVYPPRPGAEAYGDPQRFRRMQEKYCGLGGPQACTALGMSLAQEAQEPGALAGMDVALGWLVKGCGMQGQDACQRLFSISSGAIQGCDRDSRPDRCLVAGFVHRRAEELPAGMREALRADPARASEAFTRACEGGQRAACEQD